MLNIRQNYLYLNIPQVSQFFYLLLDFAQSFYWHEKECSTEFQIFQETSMTEYFYLVIFFLEKSYDQVTTGLQSISGSTETM